MPRSEPKEPDLISKSQRKRDMHALQELGKQLMSLTPAQLAKIPLSPDMAEIITEGKALKSNEAKRRFLQYVGKKMRDVDPEPIKAALTNILKGDKQLAAQLHKVEELRDQLIKEGDDGIQKLLATYPDIDRQKLRQLIRKAQHDIAKEKKTGGELQLFRYLREIILG